MPMMILTKSCKVRDQRHPAGHRFDVPEKEARLWAALGRAERAGDEPQQAELPVSADAQTRPERRAGRYNRRDMRSED